MKKGGHDNGARTNGAAGISDACASGDVWNRSVYAGEHYNPHITLCRFKNNGKADLRKKPFHGIEWITDEIFLAKKISGEWSNISTVKLR